MGYADLSGRQDYHYCISHHQQVTTTSFSERPLRRPEAIQIPSTKSTHAPQSHSNCRLIVLRGYPPLYQGEGGLHSAGRRGSQLLRQRLPPRPQSQALRHLLRAHPRIGERVHLTIRLPTPQPYHATSLPISLNQPEPKPKFLDLLLPVKLSPRHPTKLFQLVAIPGESPLQIIARLSLLHLRQSPLRHPSTATNRLPQLHVWVWREGTRFHPCIA